MYIQAHGQTSPGYTGRRVAGKEGHPFFPRAVEERPRGCHTSPAAVQKTRHGNDRVEYTDKRTKKLKQETFELLCKPSREERGHS